MRTPIVKVMIGHRRVGKSFILFQLIELIKNEDKNANVIYINKEDIEFVEIVSYRELYDYISKRLVADRKNYIFIDEIQEIAPRVQLLDGFKRFYAARLLKRESLQCQGMDVEDQTDKVMILTFNGQGASLADFEQAQVVYGKRNICLVRKILPGCWGKASPG